VKNIYSWGIRAEEDEASGTLFLCISRTPMGLGPADIWGTRVVNYSTPWTLPILHPFILAIVQLNMHVLYQGSDLVKMTQINLKKKHSSYI
jgi:hypothetical protein